MDSKEMKNQAQYIWNRLDDLASNDPTAYKKFIESQMEQQKVLESAPEPKLCVQTQTPDKQDVFVNILGWKRIPYPETDEEPVKLMAGFESTLKSKSGKQQILVPVALNDKMLQECLDVEVNKDPLIKLILDLIEDQKKIKISRSYKIHKEIYVGTVPAQPQTLFLSKSSIPNMKDMKKMMDENTVKTPEDLLKQLSTEESSGDSSNIDPKEAMDSLLHHNKTSATKAKKLIEEVDEKMEDSDEQNQTLLTPEYVITEMPRNEKYPARFQLKIHLPLVSNVSECNLNITEESAELIVPQKYFLKLQFPSSILEDNAAAKFHKKTCYLTLNLPKK